MNHRKAAESGDSIDFCQEVSVHEVMDCLMIHGICIFNKHLGEQPVRLRVTGQKDGVLLRWLLMQLEYEKNTFMGYNILHDYMTRQAILLQHKFCQWPVSLLASVCFLGSRRTNRVQQTHAEIHHHKAWLVFRPSSSGHRGRYFPSVWEGKAGGITDVW